MKVEINIECGNAAFADGSAGYEIARILKALADKVDGMATDAPSNIKLYDVNGNAVGHFKLLV